VTLGFTVYLDDFVYDFGKQLGCNNHALFHRTDTTLALNGFRKLHTE
jgi:hypothetical protein